MAIVVIRVGEGTVGKDRLGAHAHRGQRAPDRGHHRIARIPLAVVVPVGLVRVVGGAVVGVVANAVGIGVGPLRRIVGEGVGVVVHSVAVAVVVTGVAQAVVVQVGLVGVGDEWAVVGSVGLAVAVGISPRGKSAVNGFI